jgi:hypothetical protein
MQGDGEMPPGHCRDPEKLKEYLRLFDRLQQIRPYDGPDEIEKLVELVENGTLKEQGDTFVVRRSEEPMRSAIVEQGIIHHYMANSEDWEPSSNTTARIPLSELEDEYFSVPAHWDDFRAEMNKATSGVPKLCLPLAGMSPVPWMQQFANFIPGFRSNTPLS